MRRCTTPPVWLLVLVTGLLAACQAPASGPPPAGDASQPSTVALPLVTVEGSATPGPTATVPAPTEAPPTPTETPAAPVATETPRPLFRVLLVTATEGFYHSSIPTAQRVVQQIAADSGQFTVDLLATSDELGVLDAAYLAGYDVLVFANTSGELPFDGAQRQAILDFVAGGNAFIGTHSATDTLYGWPAYGDLIGAYFDSHPWTQPATVDVEDTAHPANEGLGTAYDIMEEFYTFRENPRPGVHVLQSLNAGSVGASGDFPLVWCKPYGTGRVYYNALGHFSETWQDTRFQSQLLGALRWAVGLAPAACDP